MKTTRINPDALQAIKKFNDREFFTAHEFFEAAWRETKDESKEFYRALLQISAGYFRLTENRPKAADKFFNLAHKWLQGFPNNYLNFDLQAIKNNLHNLSYLISQGIDVETIIIQTYQPLEREKK
jgi:predicted metal-dependent hydrolase